MSKVKLPKIDWKTAVCPVCGSSHDYIRRKPRTCKNGECIHKYQFKIDVENWDVNKKEI